MEPESLDVGEDATPDQGKPRADDAPALPEAEDQKTQDPHKHLKYRTKTKTHDQLKTEERPKPAGDTSPDGPDRTYPDPDHLGPVTRNKRRQAAVLNVWNLTPSE